MQLISEKDGVIIQLQNTLPQPHHQHEDSVKGEEWSLPDKSLLNELEERVIDLNDKLWIKQSENQELLQLTQEREDEIEELRRALEEKEELLKKRQREIEEVKEREVREKKNGEDQMLKINGYYFRIYQQQIQIEELKTKNDYIENV